MSLSGSTITRQAARSNSLRSVATRPLLPGGADPSYGAAHRGAAYRQPRDSLHVVAALSKGEVERSSRSAARRLLAFSSSFGADPGLFLGASDSPRCALLA